MTPNAARKGISMPSWFTPMLIAITPPIDNGRSPDNPEHKNRKSRIIAHRGRDTLSAAENVIENLDGLSPWVAGVEIDVRISADGVPVLIHDRTVDRTTNGSGAVSRLTVNELQKLKVKESAQDDTSIPTLEAYLQAAEGRPLELFLLDMKDADQRALKLTVEILNRSPLKDQCIMMVRSETETAYLREVSHDARLGRFGVSTTKVDAVINDLHQKRGELVLTPHDRYDEHRNVVRIAQAAGLCAGCSTNNDLESLQRALSDRADIILTDIACELGELIRDR